MKVACEEGSDDNLLAKGRRFIEQRNLVVDEAVCPGINVEADLLPAPLM